MAKVFKRVTEVYLNGETQDVWVLFVIDEGERNICDQKLIEVEAFQSYGFRSLRMKLAQIAERITSYSEGKIRIDGNKEVAFVYKRKRYQF